MTQVHRISWACVALVLAVGVGGSAAVAANSAVVDAALAAPEDTIAFVAFGGGDELKGDFEKSTLGRIWNDPGVRSFYQSIKTQLWAKVQKGPDPNEVKQMDMALAWAQLAASRPILCGVAALKGPMQREKPPVYGYAILDAGARKPQFEAAVKQIETLIGVKEIADVTVGSARMRGPKDRDVPLYWGWSGNYLVVAVNDANGLAMQRLQKPGTSLPGYLAKVPGEGNALVVHVDFSRAIGLFNAFVGQIDAKPNMMVMALVQGLGLAGAKSSTVRVGFAGADLVIGKFVDAPAPRTGVLGALKPIDPAMMDLVDARAVQAGEANVDVAAVYDSIMQAVKTMAGKDSAEVEKGLADFEAQIKVNIRKDLIASLSGPVVFYTLGMGAVPESPSGGVAVLVKLKDAALFEKTLTSLGDYAAAQSKGQFQAASQPSDAGRTVHTWIIPQLAMAQIMPAWSVAKDYAVIGSNLGVHDAAVKQMTSTGEGRKSIRDTEGYKAATAKLPENVVTLSYTDSQTQYTQAMAQLQQYWPMAAMFATQAGMQLPAMLPQLGPIIKDMKPASRFTWVSPDGLYSQYRGPGVEPSLAGVAGVAIGAGVMMPALSRSRGQAREISSRANLRQIGLALVMYADDNNGNFPPDLKGLEKYLGNNSAKMLESPRKPTGFTGPSYIYVPGQTTKGQQPAQTVLVYENPEFAGDSISAVFMDGHVEAMKPDRFREVLEGTYKRLGKPMPELKLKE